MSLKIEGNYALPNLSGTCATLQTYAAEPAIGQTGIFKDAMNTAANFALRSAEKGLDVLTGNIGGVDNAMDSLQGLLEQQIGIQAEMQKFTMATNIEHTKHETRMSAIRNLRVG